MTKTESLYKAHDYLVEKLFSGVEWPDAHTAAVLKFGIDGDALTDLYDTVYEQWSEENHQRARNAD